jgi:hypothetical protein
LRLWVGSAASSFAGFAAFTTLGRALGAGSGAAVRAAAFAAVLVLGRDFSFATVTRRARAAGFERPPFVLTDRRTARAMREV